MNVDNPVKQGAYGSFHRDIVLPDGVDVDQIEANYENGVLTVRIPVPEHTIEVEPKRKIEISTPEKQIA